MILHINARFYTQHVTGVQRYGRELVAAIDSIVQERGLPGPWRGIALHVPASARDTVPQFPSMEIRSYGVLRGHLWEQLELPARCQSGVLFCPANMAPIASLLAHAKIVVTVHDLSFRYFPSTYSVPFRVWYSLVTPLILRRATRIVTVSRSEAVSISQAYPRASDRLIAIQNGGAPATTDGPLVPPLVPLQSPYVVYVGSPSRRKNFPRIIAAFHRLAERHRDLHLVIVGDLSSVFRGPSGARNRGDGERIIFMGQVDDARALSVIYRGAECLVFPSLYEASPLPPIEAMAYSCPVVAADIPSLRERCGDAAFYCDPNSTDSIAGAVEYVIQNRDVADSLRQKGLERASAFTWRACAEGTLSILSAVAAS